MSDPVTTTVDGADLYRVWHGPDGWIPDTPTRLRVAVEDTLDTSAANRVASLTGYAWRAHMNGQRLLRYTRDTASSVTFDPLPPFRRTDPATAWDTFLDVLVEYVAFGTPIRTTDRAGTGTKGTRLVPGLGAAYAPQITIWVDSALPLSSARFLQAMTGVPTRTR